MYFRSILIHSICDKFLSALYICFICSIIIVFSVSPSYSKPSINVTFLNPDKKNNGFWDAQTSFMKASAEDLGINLTVIYSADGNWFEYNRLAKSILEAPNKPDYLICIFKRGLSNAIIKTAQKEKVRCFTINTDVPEENLKTVGKPRKIYSNWIGQMVPDDKQAGYLLADSLIKKIDLSNRNNPDKKIRIIGLTGSMDSSAAFNRKKGLEKAVAENPNTVLYQIVFTNWKKQDAFNRALGLLTRYPKTDLIWCASDAIALSAIKAAETRNLLTGKKIITGGIDWTDEGLEAVQSGKMVTTIGGHFMEGGLALVLIYDYHNGKDFKDDIGTRIITSFNRITPENVEKYRTILTDTTWKTINFKKLSKIYNPQRKKYNFTLHEVISGK